MFLRAFKPTDMLHEHNMHRQASSSLLQERNDVKSDKMETALTVGSAFAQTGLVDEVDTVDEAVTLTVTVETVVVTGAAVTVF